MSVEETNQSDIELPKGYSWRTIEPITNTDGYLSFNEVGVDLIKKGKKIGSVMPTAIKGEEWGFLNRQNPNMGFGFQSIPDAKEGLLRDLGLLPQSQVSLKLALEKATRGMIGSGRKFPEELLNIIPQELLTNPPENHPIKKLVNDLDALRFETTKRLKTIVGSDSTEVIDELINTEDLKGAIEKLFEETKFPITKRQPAPDDENGRRIREINALKQNRLRELTGSDAEIEETVRQMEVMAKLRSKKIRELNKDLKRLTQEINFLAQAAMHLVHLYPGT